MVMFELHTTYEQQSNMGSSFADVVFTAEKPTLADFVDYVVRTFKSECGEIIIVKDVKQLLDSVDKAEYGYGELRNGFSKTGKNSKRISRAVCCYAWCAYDFYVELEG